MAMMPHGVFRFDGVSWQPFTPENCGLPTRDVMAIATDQSGRIWFAVLEDNSTSFVSYDGDRWETYASADFDTEDLVVQSFVFDKNDALWVGAYDPGGKKRPQLWNLAHVENQWVRYTVKNSGLPDNFYISCLIVDAANRLWMGPGTVGILDGKDWRHWEAMIPGVQHGPLSQTEVARARRKGDIRPYVRIGGHLAIDKQGRIWTMALEKDYRKLCMFTESKV